MFERSASARHAVRLNPTATAATLLCLALTATQARAQASDRSEATTLEKVVVTAQKKEQAAIDVPASVTAVSADRLTRSGFTRLEDYVAEVPGLSLSSPRQGLTQVVIRGTTTGQRNSGSTTSFYIDEAPIGSVNAYAGGNAITPDIDPSDLRRIEVLKGPQGTLYGAGAIGGILRYVTASPDFESFSGAITLGGHSVAGEGTGGVGRVTVNIPFGTEAKMALRVSAFRRDDAGYINNVGTKTEESNSTRTEGGRVAFAWKIAKDWRLDASMIQQSIASDGPNAVLVDHATLVPTLGDLKYSTVIPTPIKVDLNVGNVTLRGQLGDYSLTSSTTYQTVSTKQVGDATPTYGAALGPAFHIPDLGMRLNSQTRTERWSQEVRAGSTAFSEKLEYEGGMYFTGERSSNAIPSIDPFSTTTGAAYPLPEIASARIDSRYREASLFANATYAVTSQIDVQGGVRFGKDHQPYHQDYHGALIGPVPVIINNTADDSKTTWLASARYKPTSAQAFYVRAATGYRPGGPNAVPPNGVPGVSAPQAFQSDALLSYEAGYKADLADGKASLEAAVFNTDWKNVQIQTSGGGYNFLVNGGTARSRGAEATLYLFPMRGLNLRVSVSYTQAVLTSNAPAAKGVSGDELPFVPKVNGSLSGEYRWALTTGWSASLGGSVNYVGSRVSDFSGVAPTQLPSFTTVNLNAGMERNGWRLALYLKNLTDERGINSFGAVGLAPGSNPYAAGLIQPRTVGADLTYRF